MAVTFLVARHKKYLYAKLDKEKKYRPSYCFWYGDKAFKRSDTGEWYKYAFPMDADAWEKAVSKKFHLEPGGGPIRMKIVLSKDQENIRVLSVKYVKGN